MSRYHSYLASAVLILKSYHGEEPFGSFLKKFFAGNKKYGSTDRKQIGHLCYCYFRLGKALLSLPMEERLLIALFFCSDISNELLSALRPEWDVLISSGIKDKCELLGIEYKMLRVFPWLQDVSHGIETNEFNESFFIQPDLFIRIRPGKEKIVVDKLQQAEIDFQPITSSCISLPNGSKIEKVTELNKEVVIQDRSSQQTADFLPDTGQLSSNGCPSIWDCCAASGGKSIMVKDMLGNIDLTVSDIRKSILINLGKRFNEVGIKNYKSFTADVAASYSPLPTHHSPFDLIIADVPCTGSGTWGRTPEQLFYFEEKKIAEYATKQKKILANVIPSLKPGGYLLYITCSVFKNENENIIELIREKHFIQLVKMEIIKGYEQKADTMFAALLQKPL